MIVMYEVNKYRQHVKKVGVERETEKCIFIRGQRRAKNGNHYNYFNTRADALNFVIKRAIKKVDSTKLTIEAARRRLPDLENNVTLLKEELAEELKK